MHTISINSYINGRQIGIISVPLFFCRMVVGERVNADRNYCEGITSGNSLSCKMNIDNKESIIMPFYIEEIDFDSNIVNILEPDDKIFYPECIETTEEPTNDESGIETTENYTNTFEIMMGSVLGTIILKKRVLYFICCVSDLAVRYPVIFVSATKF
eukprot:12884_1